MSISLSRLRGKRLLGGVAAIAAAAVVLSGCTSPGGSKTSSSSTSKTLTIAATSTPTSLNPYLQNVDPVSNFYIQLAYDPLIRIDTKGVLQPDLATSWKFLDSASTQLELTIRQGVKFSDGTALTAQGVADSLSYGIKSGVNGPSWLGTVTSVKATSATTVVLTSSESNSSLPSLLTQRVLLGSVIGAKGLANPTSLKTSTNGAGPYVLDASKTVADSVYVYTPNKNYWNKSEQHWGQVKIEVLASATAALQAVQNGDAQLYQADAQTATAAKQAGLSVEAPRFGLLGMNYIDRTGAIQPALKDVRVRQALNYAIDTAAVTKAAYGVYGDGGGDLAITGSIGFEDSTNNAYPYDPAKAKQLLAAAGYPNGFTVNVAYSSYGQLMVQAVAADWAKIGVTAKLTSFTDEGQAVTAITGKKFPIAFYGYGELPPFIVAKSFFSGGTNQYNPWNTQDAQLSADLKTAASAGTAAGEQTGYATAFARAYKDLAWFGGVSQISLEFIYDPKVITGVGTSGNNPGPNVAWDVKPAS